MNLSRSPVRHNPHAPLDPGPNSRQNLVRQRTSARGRIVKQPKQMSEGQRAYEARRAAKAGLSMEKWLAAKERDRLAEEKAKAKAIEAAKPAKPPGFFRRLLERAHKPLGS
jgi:hypothetical protein